MTATTAEAFAPAKVNLALHVTGQQSDGYHLLDSLVMFADVGDRVTVRLADEMSITVTGPRADGVPADGRNLCWRAAELAGVPVAITLEKHLPAAAGIGGGSSDAAAVLRAIADLTGTALPDAAAGLGADVPVCLHGCGCRMAGIGDVITPLDLPALPAVLVNPGVDVPTPAVFKALEAKNNPAMAPVPGELDVGGLTRWLAAQRNDLQPPACALEPVIRDCLQALAPARLARMSGSGATCFGICDSIAAARDLAAEISKARPGWWVAPCILR